LYCPLQYILQNQQQSYQYSGKGVNPVRWEVIYVASEDRILVSNFYRKVVVNVTIPSPTLIYVNQSIYVTLDTISLMAAFLPPFHPWEYVTLMVNATLLTVHFISISIRRRKK
jgi:hypothetical protein